MSMFDSLHVPCPRCGKPVEFQSKAHERQMNCYTLTDAPPEILEDVINSPEYCMSCGQWVALIDPRYPPGEKPRPDLRAAKVRDPDNPSTHSQGYQWWPSDVPFGYEHLEDGEAP